MPQENASLVDQHTTHLRASEGGKSLDLATVFASVQDAVSGSIVNQTWNSVRSGIEHDPSLRQQIEGAYSSGREKMKGGYLPVRLEIELGIYGLGDENFSDIATMLRMTLQVLLRTYHPQIVGFRIEDKDPSIERIPNTTSVKIVAPVLLRVINSGEFFSEKMRNIARKKGMVVLIDNADTTLTLRHYSDRGFYVEILKKGHFWSSFEFEMDENWEPISVNHRYNGGQSNYTDAGKIATGLYYNELAKISQE